MGGYKAGAGDIRGTDEIYRFHPASGAVQLLPTRLAIGVFDSVAVWSGSHAYLLGGLNQTENATSIVREVQRFDPEQGIADLTGAEFLNGRFGASAVWTGSHAFIFSGYDYSSSLHDLVRFSPGPGTLDIMDASFPFPLFDSVAVADGAGVYVLGGVEANRDRSRQELDRIQRYALDSDTLTVLPNKLPRPMSGHVLAGPGPLYYLVGGTGPVVRFDVRDGTATETPDQLPEPRDGAAAFWYNGGMYLVGGFNGTGSPTQIVRYVPTPISTDGGPVSTTSASILTTGSPPLSTGEDQNSASVNSESDATSVPDELENDPPPANNGSPSPWLFVGVGVPILAVAGLMVYRGRVARRTQATAPPVAARTRTGQGALEVRDVSVDHGGKRTLSEVNLQVPPGQLVFLLGPSGSGKSTLLRAIVGLQDHKGEIRIHGRPAQGQRTQIGFVPQDLQLYPNLSPLDNAAYLGGQFGLTRRVSLERAARLLDDLNLAQHKNRPVSKLSGGQQRRASIVAALIPEPALLVLDEPTSGLDFSARKSLWGVVARLASDRNVGILATTHFIDDADHGDAVGILHDGRLVAFGAPKTLIRSLPGAGRCIEVDFENLSDAQRRRLLQRRDEWKAQGRIERLDVDAFRARILARDPQSLLAPLTEQLHRDGFEVREITLDEVTLQDVFIHHTGERPPPETT